MADSQRASPDEPLVVVLQTDQSALLPLVQAAFEQAGIDCAVRNVGLSDQIVGHRVPLTVGDARAPFELVVRAEDEARATALIRDLETPVTAPLPEAGAVMGSVSTTASAASTGVDVDLFNAATGVAIGTISEAQLQSLAEHLEEESSEDEDYYIDEATLAMLQDVHVDAGVIQLLRGALGTTSGLDVRWSRRR